MSIDVNAIEQTVVVTAVGDEVNVNIIDQPVLVSVTDQIISVEASGAAGPQGPVGAGVAAGGTTGQVLSKASGTNYDTVWVDAGAGTVYSVNASGSTGISVSGGPITGAGTLTITNTAPDQVVGLTGAGTAVITGTYPNFTITANDQYSGTVTSVNLTAGTGISVSGGPITSSGSINVVNTSPDQVVSLTGGGTTTITGTYPNFTISSTDSTVGTVTSVNMTVPTGLTISGNPITSAGTLALALASGYSIPTTASQATWDAAYNDKINSAAVTGTTTKTLTLNQQDGGTVTASWTDINTDAVTSVFGRTGAVVATGGDYTTTQVTEGTNLYYTEGRVSANTDVAANTAARHNAVTIGTANGLSLSTQALSLALSSASTTGALSSTDWSTFNNKQNAISLSTTGSSGASTFISNTLNVPTYTLSGLGGVPTSRTLTINGTAFDLSADRTFSVGTVTSITLATGTTGTDVNVSNGTITSSGTITLNIPDASATARGLITTGIQTIAGAKTFSSSPTVPSLYLSDMTAGSGALYYNVAANRLTLANYNVGGILVFETNGGSINMTLDASANLSVVGSVTAASLIKSGGTSSQFLKADGSVDSSTYYLASNPSAYIALTALTASAPLSYNNTTGAFTISQASGSVNGFLSSTDWTTFNNKQNTITNPVTGTGTTNYLPKWTSGSAIGNSQVFDNGTNVGIGTASPVSALDVSGRISLGGALYTNVAQTESGAGTLASGYNFNLNNGSPVHQATGGMAGVWYNTGSIQWYTNSSQTANTTATERMRITSGGNLLVNSTTDNGNRLQVTGNGYFSGNVGVGTASPDKLLTLLKNNDDAILIKSSESNYSGLYLGVSTTSGFGYISTSYNGSGANLPLAFGTAGTEKMRLDTSGNLGLGVTPSAWSAGKAIQVDSVAVSLWGVGNQTALMNNAYYNSGDKYAVNGEASYYLQASGSHKWFNAPSGTAGNAITFTQAMTLTANGRLLLGTTTEGTDLLQVNGSAIFSNDLKFSVGASLKWGSNTYIYGDNNVKIEAVVNGNTALTLASTGAATFSSSVTAGSFYTPGFVVPTSAKAVFNNVNYSGPAWNNASFVTGNGATGVMMGGDAATYIYGWIQGVQTDTGANKGLYLNPLGANVFVGGNLLVGTTTDSGYKLNVNGGIYGKGITADSDGGVGNALYAYNQVLSGSSTNALIQLATTWNTTGNADAIVLDVTNTASGASSRLIDLKVGGSSIFKVQRNGRINASSLPTSSAGLSAGDIWNDGGTLKIV